MKRSILALCLMAAGCTTAGDGSRYDQLVEEAARLHIVRHGAAQAQPVVELGWGDIFTDSRNNDNCEQVVRSLGLWAGNTVCRQNDQSGVGQVLYILSERQKNSLRLTGRRLVFEYKPGAAGTMPVYQALRERYWRHHHY